MGAGAGKRIGVEDDGDPHARPTAVASTVVTVLPKRGPEVDTAADAVLGDEAAGSHSPKERPTSSVSSAGRSRREESGGANSPVSQDFGSGGRPTSAAAPAAEPGAVTLQGAIAAPSRTGTGTSGGFRPGQPVRLVGLEKAGHLNGVDAVTKFWDSDGHRWVIRMADGSEKRVRAENLQAWQPKDGGAPHGPAARARAGGVIGVGAVASDANKELETLLLQTNWSAIYQLFHQRFSVAALDKLDRGYVVKSAVEMTLSIVAKCFALLRSDPSGRLHCTPLHIAALQSSTEAAEVIVRDLPQLVAQTHTASHSALCPLHIAILCGAHAIIELLLEGKANPNVRTLHDVCPLHLAATTSKDVCQLLLSYGAEPQLRDVMGSTSLHYAAAFKQHPVMELLLNHDRAGRLANDVDQKRVTPLHISCALYHEEEDFAAPMVLLAHGAKPYQADCHGASARELVPWSRDSLLLRFFENNGDQVQGAAQRWLEEQYLNKHDKEEAAEATMSAGPDDDDGHGGRAAHPRRADPKSQGRAFQQQPQQQPSQRRPSQIVDAQAQAAAAAGPAQATPTAASAAAAASAAQLAEMAGELDRLKAELAQAHERCAGLERENRELEHFRAKCSMLEQAAATHARVFENLQTLYDTERHQHQQQLDALQQRHAVERAGEEARSAAQLEAIREEACRDVAQQLERQQREFNTQLQELQTRLETAQASAAAAERAYQRTSTLAERTPTKPTADVGELQRQIEGLQGEVQRLTALEEQARAWSERQGAELQEIRAAVRGVCVNHSIGAVGEAPSELLARVDAEIARIRSQAATKEAEYKAVYDQLQRLNEEASMLRLARAQGEDHIARLELARQELENRSSAAVLKLETRLQEAELRAATGLSQLRSEAEAHQRRADAAEQLGSQLQQNLDKLKLQLHALEVQFAEEQALRKKYHNQIQDMKGAIRVFCRFRPMIAREAGDGIACRRVDAFTAELARGPPHNDVRPYQFDSVFDGNSTQEEVFADCKELVQSAVDGYNVTIFAYGQTGAGKTHTMYGNPQQPGLVPRSVNCLFDVIKREEKSGNKKFKVKTYMIEVYKQDILDLLTDKPPPKDKKSGQGLEVKKDLGRGIMYVEGVTEKEISSPEELLAYLAEGEKRRHVAATKMNSASSRSHLLLSVIIECFVKDTGQVLYGKITMCDLAGSERPKKSEVSGEGLKEAIEINKSLSALGDVIEALTKGAKSIPYRNHKLTMLMQDSLGGSAKTLMFVNCSPAGSNAEETQMSLSWAARARQVTNDVKRNADSKEVARLKQVIAMMSQAQNAEVSLDEPVPDLREEAVAGMDMQMALNATMRVR